MGFQNKKEMIGRSGEVQGTIGGKKVHTKTNDRLQ